MYLDSPQANQEKRCYMVNSVIRIQKHEIKIKITPLLLA